MDSYEIKQFKRLRHAQKNVPAWVNLFMSPVAPVPIMAILFAIGFGAGMCVERGDYILSEVGSAVVFLAFVALGIFHWIAHVKLDLKKHQYREPK